MKCIRFDVCKFRFGVLRGLVGESSMKCIRFDVCKWAEVVHVGGPRGSSMKCIRFDVCKVCAHVASSMARSVLNEVHTF